MTRKATIAVLQSQGFQSGRVIALSKSGYRKVRPKHFVIFNAKVFSCRRGMLLKSVDLDLTLDAEQLTAAARVIGENLYVLCENDPTFFWQQNSRPVSQVLQYAIWWTRIRPEDQDTFIAVDSAPRRPNVKRLACTTGTGQGQPAYSVDCWTNPTCGGCNMSASVVQLQGRPPKNMHIAAKDEVFTAVASVTRGRPTRPMFYHRSGPLEYVWFTHGAALPARLYDGCIRQLAAVTFTIHRETNVMHIRRDGEAIGLIWPCSIAAPEVVASARQKLQSVLQTSSAKGGR